MMQKVSVAIAVVVAFALVTHAAPGPLVVDTQYGQVRGSTNDHGRQWLGIPYTAPPVGDLRWSDPAPPAPWSGIKNTTQWGPACPQHCMLPPSGCQNETSEDCLYLNVYSPAADGVYPVMVWFHGGRYEQGSEGVELYNGKLVADAYNMVVVTVNYRLGVLGFMSRQDLGVSGNFGVRDQRFSLEWVARNIQGFGGNASQVTIFGQSAGATSVSFHLTSPQSKGLFQGAIVESSPYSLPLLSLKDAEKHYKQWTSETTCKTSDLACMRNLSPEAVVAAEVKAQNKIHLKEPLSMFFPWTPVTGNPDLPLTPLEAFDKGEYAHVPVTIGNVAQEARMFVWDAFPALNKLEAEALVDVIFGGHHEPKDIYEQYPFPQNPGSNYDYRNWISPLASDFIIDCSSRNVSRVLARDGVPVQRYRFNHAWSVRGVWGPLYPFCEGHACHGVELPFVFNSIELFKNYKFTQGEAALGQQLSAYWAAFAGSKTAAQKLANDPAWTPYKPGTDDTFVFQASNTTTTSMMQTKFRTAFCDFWDKSPKGYVF
eukprot:m.95101 g.95101  ORF g.95101 m.95101 type:complete len:540 (-) comp13040_c0_seq1:1744-3363(-)